MFILGLFLGWFLGIITLLWVIDYQLKTTKQYKFGDVTLIVKEDK